MGDGSSFRALQEIAVATLLQIPTVLAVAEAEISFPLPSCRLTTRALSSLVSFAVGFFATDTEGASLVAAAEIMAGPRQRFFNPEVICILQQ